MVNEKQKKAIQDCVHIFRMLSPRNSELCKESLAFVVKRLRFTTGSEGGTLPPSLNKILINQRKISHTFHVKLTFRFRQIRPFLFDYHAHDNNRNQHDGNNTSSYDITLGINLIK